MTKLLKLIVPVIMLALCFKANAQVIGNLGDVQVDEREFYTMTKQMGQFIHRFNLGRPFWQTSLPRRQRLPQRRET